MYTVTLCAMRRPQATSLRDQRHVGCIRGSIQDGSLRGNGIYATYTDTTGDPTGDRPCHAGVLGGVESGVAVSAVGRNRRVCIYLTGSTGTN